MTIQVGDALPNATLKRVGQAGLEDIVLSDYIKDRKIVLFGFPGAFTPSCAQKHVPGYVASASKIKATGVDEIIGVAVNDPFTLKNFGDQLGVDGKVTLLPDWNAAFVGALGLTFDASGAGLGIRSSRFSMIVENGVVTSLDVEAVPSAVELSGADVCLVKLGA